MKNLFHFFQKYKIIGVKAKDYADFCKVAEMMKLDKHLPPPPQSTS